LHIRAHEEGQIALLVLITVALGLGGILLYMALPGLSPPGIPTALHSAVFPVVLLITLAAPAIMVGLYQMSGREEAYPVPEYIHQIPNPSLKPWMVNLLFSGDPLDIDENGVNATVIDLARRGYLEMVPEGGGSARGTRILKTDTDDPYEEVVLKILGKGAGNVIADTAESLGPAERELDFTYSDPIIDVGFSRSPVWNFTWPRDIMDMVEEEQDDPPLLFLKVKKLPNIRLARTYQGIISRYIEPGRRKLLPLLLVALAIAIPVLIACLFLAIPTLPDLVVEGAQFPGNFIIFAAMAAIFGAMVFLPSSALNTYHGRREGFILLGIGVLLCAPVLLAVPGAVIALVPLLQVESALIFPTTLFGRWKGEYYREKLQWDAFTAFLSDLAMVEKYGPKDIGMWGDWLVYGTSLGCGEGVAAALKKLDIQVPEAAFVSSGLRVKIAP
jgi:hypothetical protein